jgi:hypothetical protein
MGLSADVRQKRQIKHKNEIKKGRLENNPPIKHLGQCVPFGA